MLLWSASSLGANLGAQGFMAERIMICPFASLITPQGHDDLVRPLLANGQYDETVDWGWACEKLAQCVGGRSIRWRM